MTTKTEKRAPHDALIQTEADGLAFPRRTTIEHSDSEAFAFEVAKEIASQIETIAGGKTVSTTITLHIVEEEEGS